jgi:hypothetical protein
MFKPGSASKWRRWVPLLGILYAGTIIIGVLAVSPFGCSLLPPVKTGRFVMLHNNANSLLFGIEGYYRCAITAEGPFPHWYAAVGLVFKDRQAFLNFDKELYTYPNDFVSQGHYVVSGTIKLDKLAKTATVDLQYTDDYSYVEPANGVYDMSNPKPQAR